MSFFFFKQKTAYEMRISDWSSDVCSSDLQDGATAIFIGIDKQAAGILAIADAIKATTAEAIAALRKEGIRVVMLTGDNRTTAEAVGRKLGIDEVEAEVLPDQKSAVVARLKGEGRIVADRKSTRLNSSH